MSCRFIGGRIDEAARLFVGRNQRLNFAAQVSVACAGLGKKHATFFRPIFGRRIEYLLYLLPAFRGHKVARLQYVVHSGESKGPKGNLSLQEARTRCAESVRLHSTRVAGVARRAPFSNRARPWRVRWPTLPLSLQWTIRRRI